MMTVKGCDTGKLYSINIDQIKFIREEKEKTCKIYTDNHHYIEVVGSREHIEGCIELAIEREILRKQDIIKRGEISLIPLSLAEKVKREKRELEEKLLMRIDDPQSPQLSIRLSNILRLSGFHIWADICKYKEGDMTKYRGMGKKAFIELKNILLEMGLHYEMDCHHLIKNQQGA